VEHQKLWADSGYGAISVYGCAIGFKWNFHVWQ